jgi:glycosyltransferase involved in cell wall biosynthesis
VKIALIDPSLFTIPYDEALGGALTELGCSVRLYGRRLRPSEHHAGVVPLEPFFYRAAERLGPPLPRRAIRIAKGAEHALDMLRLRRRLAAERPKVIHFQWAPLPIVDRFAVRALRRLAPVVLTVHDTTPFNGSPNEAVQAIGADSIFAAFDHLIVHTEAGKRLLSARGLPAGRISVIAHGTLRLPEGGSPRGTGTGGEQVILAFGKIKPYKGIDLLIEAFAALPPALRAAVRLRIVGEPFMPIEPLQRQAAARGVAERIDWDLRYVHDEEIGGIVAAADILAFPYRQIDASGVLMAALPYGKPIVASAMGAFAELLRDGVHGRLVAPGDVAALTAALAGLIAEPARARAMGEAVRDIAELVPGWREIGERTVALYARLAAAAPAAGVLGEIGLGGQLRP